ncbi:unnamed protein product [Porites evermanni]|uniref:Uncharacterized protein n=1 Tax=Porites evermanni TaxID=104178 RepID=A0ABN8M6Z7_9CNID|nr:unnamed protein product [Porites evermanni]
MRKAGISFTAGVLFLSLNLLHLQAPFNASGVLVSETNFSSFVSNPTATPHTATSDVLTSQTPDPVPRCNETNEKFSCWNKCEDRSTQWDELDSQGRSEEHCHCDQACLTYHDCCADYTRYCHPLSPVPQGMDNANYICSKISTDKKIATGVFMISTCAAGWEDKEVRSKCLSGANATNRIFTSANVLEGIPVALFDPLRQGIHYSNMYCGICNNVIKFFRIFWELKFRCNIKPPRGFNNTQTLDYMLKYCPTRVVLPPEQFKVRSCFPMVSSCSIEKQTQHKDGCLKGKSGVVFKGETLKNYKNYHCVLCNGLSMTEASCGPREPDTIFEPRSFEIVMQFEPLITNQQKIKRTKVTLTCPQDRVYDPHLETCRTGYVPNPLHAIRDKYRVKFWMHPLDGQMRPVTPDQFSIAFCKTFALDPSQIDEIVFASEDNSKAVAFNLYAGASSRINNLTHMPYKDNMDVSVLFNFNESFEISINNKTWEVIRVTERQLACVESVEYFPGEFKLLPTGQAKINKTGQTLPSNRFFVVNDGSNNKSLFVCKSKFTVQCSFLLLPLRSYEYTIFANKTLLHIITGRVYSTGEYDVNGEKVMICTNYTNYQVNYTNTSTQVIEANITAKTESRILRYFTVVGFSVSVFALVLTLVIHSIFAEMRRPLPGKNLMSLCLALTLAQFTWMLGTGDTDKPTFCTTVAAVIHYLFLVSFACMAIIAFDTRRTFSSQISRAPGISIGGQNKNIRFLKYTCLSWGLPMLFVGGCVILDHFQVVFIGYGNEDACWLVSSNGKIIVFAVPISSVLLYNIGAFSHTIWAINSARKQTIRVKSARQDQKVVLKIYLRLVTLMGFTWFFSFSAELVHKTLIYPFVALTAIQGVFIFVAFVCKTRVLKLIKDSFLRSRKDVLASTRPTASTDSRSLPPTYSQYRSETEDTHI